MPSTKNFTPKTPILSLAVADSVTMLLAVNPLDGDVSETVGAVVSAKPVTKVKFEEVEVPQNRKIDVDHSDDEEEKVT